jgi:hypothetical protein
MKAASLMYIGKNVYQIQLLMNVLKTFGQMKMVYSARYI